VKAIQRILHGIRLVSKCLELLKGTQIEPQRVQVNQCQFCVVETKNDVAFSGTEFVQCLLFRLLHEFCTDLP